MTFRIQECFCSDPRARCPLHGGGRPELVIRTNTQHLTITEAHPFHGTVEHRGLGTYPAFELERDGAGNSQVFEKFDEACPKCRAERDQKERRPTE